MNFNLIFDEEFSQVSRKRNQNLKIETPITKVVLTLTILAHEAAWTGTVIRSICVDALASIFARIFVTFISVFARKLQRRHHFDHNPVVLLIIYRAIGQGGGDVTWSTRGRSSGARGLPQTRILASRGC